MWDVEPFKAEDTLAPARQLKSRRATHAAHADDNDVIHHAYPIAWQTVSGRSEERDYVSRMPAALVFRRHLLAKIRHGRRRAFRGKRDGSDDRLNLARGAAQLRGRLVELSLEASRKMRAIV